jgi:uroporphyrinogen decarboxylase
MKTEFSESFNDLLNGEKADRVPHLSFVLGFCARNTGYPLVSIYSDPEKSFQAQLFTREQYGYDSDLFYGYASYGGWEFGGEIKLPDGEFEQAPSIVRHAVQKENDIEMLRIPDVKKDGSLPLAMQFSKIQVENGMNPTLVVAGPFTVAGNICSVSRLCKWLIKAPEYAHHTLRMATDHLIDTADYWVKTFGKNSVSIQIWEPLATNQVISPRLFEKYVLPYQIELHQKILDAGIRYILCHICGDQNMNLPFWQQVPMGEPGIVSIGKEIEITTAIKYFGKTSIIAGNISPTFIQTGTPREIYEACREAIEIGKKAPLGYALMEGCEVPVNTPPYNYYSMRKAVYDFGKY